MSTRRALPKLLFILFSLILLSSCNKPTYPKEKLAESIKNLCKKEYGMDVDVKIIGSTIGVLLHIEGLVDKDLQLDKDAGEKIEDVALSIHRVATSTDSPLKIYTLTARDPNTPGAEFVLTGFVYDVLRVRLLDISRGEYHKRILRDFRFNPTVIAEEKIVELIETLDTNSILTYNLRDKFYPIYTIGKKDSQKIVIVEMKAKELSDQESLFYIKTRESYKALPGFEMSNLVFPPSGFDNEYLILVNIAMFPYPIQEIIPKYLSSDNELRERDLKESFDEYEDTGSIGTDGFPKRELGLDWFLSQQLAQRITLMFTEDKLLKDNFTVETSHGSIEDKIFRFRFYITSVEPSSKDDKLIFSKILKLIATALHTYPFEDFVGIELIDTQPGGRKIYLSKEELEKFRMKRLKIQDKFID